MLCYTLAEEGLFNTAVFLLQSEYRALHVRNVRVTHVTRTCNALTSHDLILSYVLKFDVRSRVRGTYVFRMVLWAVCGKDKKLT